MGEKYFTFLLDTFGYDRLRIRIETRKGDVKYFVVQYETLIEDDWFPVVRYDLAHGFFHRDMMTIKGEKEKQIISNITDFNEALSYAQDDLKSRWQMYKVKFLNKSK